MSFILKKQVTITSPTTTTTTTAAPVFGQIVIEFNQTNADSTVEFLLDGNDVLFTSKASPVGNQQFLTGSSGNTTAASFLVMFNQYKFDNNIDANYSISVINSKQVQINCNINAVTFGTVTINNSAGSNIILISQVP